jgi:hypothetical protein
MKWFFFVFAIFATALVYGQIVPSISESAGMGEIFLEVVKLFQNSEGLSYQYRISGFLFLTVALAKNSVVAPYWDKLGKLKPLVAPILSLVAFLFLVQPFTVQSAIAAIATGAAAGYLAQLVDAAKELFPRFQALISLISDIVGKIFKRPS